MIGYATRLFQLILVLPATNAVSERLFSKLKTLKDCLRSTMGHGRLNNLMIAATADILIVCLLILIKLHHFLVIVRKSLFLPHL